MQAPTQSHPFEPRQYALRAHLVGARFFLRASLILTILDWATAGGTLLSANQALIACSSRAGKESIFHSGAKANLSHVINNSPDCARSKLFN
jgi:hypothetical protein